MNNNKFNNDKNNTAVHMNAHEQRIMRGVICKTVIALTIIMTVISKNLPAVIRWVKQLKNSNDEQKLTLKGLFCSVIGEAAIYGMPTAMKNLLQGMDAPRPIIALTRNKRVVWLLNYIMDTYSMMNVKQLMVLAAQAAAIGATLDEELNARNYLGLREPDEMSDEEVENM